MFEAPKTRLVTGDRAFSVTGPKLWNEPPVVVKSCDTVNTFKMKLKTFLFNEAKKGYEICVFKLTESESTLYAFLILFYKHIKNSLQYIILCVPK